MPSLSRLELPHLLNASAGTIERRGERTLQEVLVSAFEKHGISVVLEFVPGVKLARRRSGFDNRWLAANVMPL